MSMVSSRKPEVRGSGREEDGDIRDADEVDAVLPADRVRPRAPRNRIGFESLIRGPGGSAVG